MKNLNEWEKNNIRLEQSFSASHKIWGEDLIVIMSYENRRITWKVFFLFCFWQNLCFKLKGFFLKTAIRQCFKWQWCFIYLFIFKQLSWEETGSLKLLPWKLHSSHCAASREQRLDCCWQPVVCFRQTQHSVFIHIYVSYSSMFY